MNITAHKDPARVLRNMVLGIDGIAQVEPGTRIVYHQGQTWSLSENGRKVGEMARMLQDAGRAILVQKKLPIRYEPSKEDPNIMVRIEEYEWIAIVRG